MTFSYRQYIAEIPNSPDEFRLILRPVISVRIHGTRRSRRWDALLDTGADETLMSKSVADYVGVRWIEDDSGKVQGVGGTMLPVRYGELELELYDGTETVRWPAIVGFAELIEADDAPLILGHDGCLELFSATFHGGTAEIEIVPNELMREIEVT